METKKIIKQILTVGMGVLAVGATMAGAMATTSYDLSVYPSMFIKDGKFSGTFVVGAGAKAEDVIGITNIANSLQVASTTATTVQLDDSLKVEEGYQLCNRNLYLGTSIADCEPSVDEAKLDILKDDVYHDAAGENDNDEKYTQELTFNDGGTGQFQFTQDDRYAPTADNYLYIDNGQHYLYDYKFQFDNGVDVSEDATQEDLAGTSINIQGSDYVITDAKSSGGIIKTLQMQAGDAVVWMSEGETMTRTVDGIKHDIELVDVSADATKETGSCGFKVDGTQVWVDVKDTQTVNGVTLGVTDAKRVNIQAETQDVCEVVVGAREITIKDGQEVEFNGYKIDGTMGEITQGSPSGTDMLWSGFDLSFAPDVSKVYLQAGDEYIDPMFGQFKFVFSGVETGGVETIGFDAGSHDMKITFENEDGTLVELPVSAHADATAGEAIDEPTFWGNKAPVSSDVNQDELMYLEGETCTGTVSVSDCLGAEFLVIEPTKDEAHLMQITNIDTNDNTVNVDDLTYGTNDDSIPYTDGVDSDMSLKSAGMIALNVNESAKTITFASTGAANGTTIKTKNRAILTLVNTNTSNQIFEGLLFSEYPNGGLASSDYISYMPITAVYDDLIDNTLEINSSSVSGLDSTVGYGFFDVSDVDHDNQVFTSKKGSLITYDHKDNKRLIIEHPYDTAYAKVYIAPTSSGVKTNSVTQVTVNPISVNAVKLDNEVKDAKKENIIAVGGACANSVVAQLQGNPKDCVKAMGLESGQALIKLYENGEYVALVVAGQDAMDTRLASEIMSNWKDYNLTGYEMIATTVSESSLSVESK